MLSGVVHLVHRQGCGGGWGVVVGVCLASVVCGSVVMRVVCGDVVGVNFMTLTPGFVDYGCPHLLVTRRCRTLWHQSQTVLFFEHLSRINFSIYLFLSFTCFGLQVTFEL